MSAHDFYQMSLDSVKAQQSKYSELYTKWLDKLISDATSEINSATRNGKMMTRVTFASFSGNKLDYVDSFDKYEPCDDNIARVFPRHIVVDDHIVESLNVHYVRRKLSLPSPEEALSRHFPGVLFYVDYRKPHPDAEYIADWRK